MPKYRERERERETHTQRHKYIDAACAHLVSIDEVGLGKTVCGQRDISNTLATH